MEALPLTLLLSLMRQVDGVPPPARASIAPALVLFSCQTADDGVLSVSEHDGMMYYQMRHQEGGVAFGMPATHGTYSRHLQENAMTYRLSLPPYGERAERYEVVSTHHQDKSAERFVQVVDGETIKTTHCQSDAQDILSSFLNNT